MIPLREAFLTELVKVAAAAPRSTLAPSSSNVQGFRYDTKAKQLFVTYKSGGTYRYDDVPPKAARGLGRSKSVGKAVNRLVKSPGYAYEKIGMSGEAISKIVRRALEVNPNRVGKTIRRLGETAGERAHFGKGIAVSEARKFMAGHPSIAGARAGNVLKPISGELTTQFGAGKGLPKEASGIVEAMYRRRRSIAKLAQAAKKEVEWDGLPIKIEHEPGDIRSGVSKDGTRWSHRMYASYGYISGTKALSADGEPLDVYLAKAPVQGPAYQIDQLKKDGTFDEHKFMIGFPSADEAEKTYRQHMPPWAFGSIAPVGKTFEDFKALVAR